MIRDEDGAIDPGMGVCERSAIRTPSLRSAPWANCALGRAGFMTPSGTDTMRWGAERLDLSPPRLWRRWSCSGVF
jgi:hypothetical protein